MNKEGLISRILRNQEMVLPTPRYRGLTIKQILNLENVEGQEPKNINTNGDTQYIQKQIIQNHQKEILGHGLD
jgi:hypothetical protein